MKVKDLVSLMSNGAAHVTLINNDTGTVLLKTIWYNSIPSSYLEFEVKHITITDYTMVLLVEDIEA